MAEQAALEYKLRLDLAKTGDKVRLVAEVVAMANADGGVVRVGVTDDGRAIGLTPELARRFDPAQVADLVDSFTSPEHVEITVTRSAGSDGPVVHIAVERFADPPLVMCKDGNFEEDGRTQAQFRKGDVLVRRGTRVQRAVRPDFALWTRRAVDAARQTLLDRLAFVANLPEGAELQVGVAGTDLSEPGAMLTHAVRAWAQDPTRLLGSTELAWLLTGETLLRMLDDDAVRLLVHSALRKKSTLWHWLALAQPARDRVEALVLEAIAGTDRDVSDAGRPIVDVVAVYLDDQRYERVLSALAASRHKHFRDAAAGADHRSTQVERLRSLCARPLDGADLSALNDATLQAESHAVAHRLIGGRDQAASNRVSRYGLERFRRTSQGQCLR